LKPQNEALQFVESEGEDFIQMMKKTLKGNI
jgi:hypothetical protein